MTNDEIKQYHESAVQSVSIRIEKYLVMAQHGNLNSTALSNIEGFSRALKESLSMINHIVETENK